MVENKIPTEQWAINQYARGQFKVERIKVPTPGPGQVLVKIECAPINPSDTYFMGGKYDDAVGEIVYPMVPGWEGSGTVVASGGGIMAWRLIGKRVAVTKCGEPDDKYSIGGCYQQYMMTSAMQCLPLTEEISFEEGAMHFVNPLTAIGLVDCLKQYKAQAGIQNAAASQLGKMIIRLCKEENIPLINIVRKEDQVKMLKEEMKCEYVLNSSDPDFLDQLGELAKKLKATVCFDAVAGDQAGQILTKMPRGSTLLNYGLLSESDIGYVDPMQLIFANKRVVPFFLGNWMKEQGVWKQLGIMSKCQKYLRSKVFSSTVAKRISLFEFEQGLQEYKKNMSAGKYLVYPQQGPPNEDDKSQSNNQ